MVPATPSPARGSGHCGMYPDQAYTALYAAYSDCVLREIGEKPLWHGVTRKGYRQQIRFTFTKGNAGFTRIIDFTEFADGTGRVVTRAVSHRWRSAFSMTEPRSAKVPAEAVAKLNALGDQSGAWGFENGSWDGDEVYMDCQTLDMERINAQGYRFSSVNISCHHPEKLMPLVDYLAGLAGITPSEHGSLY
jgi:hypothetical protein